ncbi:MAG: hypothetical protein GKC10_05775 [Methanosarcinales archaeon]|nr:hypothetical protein [Methanosarcinales archaeon]
MLGISDPWIWGVYVLCLLSTLLCVIYGALKWNYGWEQEREEISEELAWEKSEDELEQRLGL